MTITGVTREQVRQRARFTCEYCGIREVDTGDRLTIDHFQPTSQGGDDSLDNLLYCCMRCNQYKLDYWPAQPDAISLWNPRREPQNQHLLQLEDGTLRPLTAVGDFTLRRLRLNRPALVAHRLWERRVAENNRLLLQYQSILGTLEQLLSQQIILLENQRLLMEEYRRLLQLLLADME